MVWRRGGKTRLTAENPSRLHPFETGKAAMRTSPLIRRGKEKRFSARSIFAENRSLCKTGEEDHPRPGFALKPSFSFSISKESVRMAYIQI